jgi:hypothetical protein
VAHQVKVHKVDAGERGWLAPVLVFAPGSSMLTQL